FFVSGYFLYSVGDSEHVGKATVCRAIRTVCLALKQFLPTFVQFPGHKPLLVIKDDFHRVAGLSFVVKSMTHIIYIYTLCAHTLLTSITFCFRPGPQTRFNLAHSRTRAKVEMTIGILKSRFQCLRGLRVSPERACDIIVDCVVLHNIATIRGESHPPCIEEDGPEEHLQILEVNRNRRLLRDRICQNHFY
ncbi:putative nuclease HARBI1, partial [Silurus meridionalis]